MLETRLLRNHNTIANHDNTPQLDADPAYTPAGSMFRPQPTDSITMILVIKQLRNTSSCGSDGIPFDQNMTFDSHVKNISPWIFNIILYVNWIRNNYSKSARITVMLSLVLSIINYGIKVWGAANETHVQQIQKLQNFAAKVALGGAAKHGHVTPFMRGLGWLKIKRNVYVRTRNHDVYCYQFSSKRYLSHVISERDVHY